MGPLRLGDPELEFIDPTPDLHAMFLAFNEEFFHGALAGCEVNWSKRMTSCAGICSFQPKSGYCRISLSEPLLKLRSRKEFIETLLHEMIHGYLFVTSRNQDRDGHGPEFQKHMYRINQKASINITIYHSFHAEVALYKQHWWRCNGVCRNRPPFHGWVKRATNRAPGKNDLWWAAHQATCQGTFEKVREPEKPEKAKKPSKKQNQQKSPIKKEKSPKKKAITDSSDDQTQKKIDSFFTGKGYILGSSDSGNKNSIVPSRKIKPPDNLNAIKDDNNVIMLDIGVLPQDVPSTSKTILIPMFDEEQPGSSFKPTPQTSSNNTIVIWDIDYDNHSLAKPQIQTKSTTDDVIIIDDENSMPISVIEPKKTTNMDMIDCPACYRRIPFSLINDHLDQCAN
uniref:Protein with SprT-like domain at the N terminus n=1 Tax=Acrobeloides nanus TaxID=290746 RepID=A0A914DUR2_9BILA